MRKLHIDSNGRISLPRQTIREIGAAPLEIVSQSEKHLLFTAEAPGEKLVLAGVLGEVGIADLLSFFNLFRKTGILRFAFPSGGKDLYFQQGEIVYATSTLPGEDLGEILCSMGKVGRDELSRIRQDAGSKKAIGTLLVDRGVVAPKDLWLALRQQVETVVYNLFSCSGGSFSFIVKPLDEDENLRLSMSTQNLIMEGLRRIDERALFMRRIGSLDAIPVPGDKKPDTLPETARRMMQALDGRNLNVREVLEKCGLDEFEGLRALYQLMEKGFVRMEEAPAMEVGGDLGEILDIFNGALVAIFRRTKEVYAGFGEEMRHFMRTLPQPFSYVFRDATLLEDGALEGGRILANLAGLEEGDKKKLLAEALSELVYAECAVAQRVLGVDDSVELLQRVQEVTRPAKTLIGR